jgi:predicted RNA methylase
LSVFEIILLVLTIFVGSTIVWSTLIVGISPMPSTKNARKAMIELSEKTGPGTIYELGSGWGNILIPLAKQYPERQIIGYELSILPWLTTRLLIKVMGLNNVHVYRKNFLNENLTAASVIMCYLVPEVMSKVEKKLNVEGGKIQYLISNNFALPSYDPIATIELNDLYRSPIYLYKIK